MARKKDIQYHNKSEVVSTYDFRITRSYQFEHKYLTLQKWLLEIKSMSFQKILDFGCGTGNVSYNLVKHELQPVSMDTSLSMLKNVQSKLGPRGALCINGDGEKLPFKNGTFDAIICMGVLHHLEKKGVAVSEMMRVVKKGGKVYIAEPFLSKTKMMVFYNGILFIPRMLKNLFMGLRALETERPIEEKDYLEIIKKEAENGGGRVKAYFYLYPPLLFRFLASILQMKIFQLLNKHLRMEKNENTWIITKYTEPAERGNILEVHIEC
jgi:ubiquinone/menaquinone biosynthesis C-methylase UbiE